jgi:hypothetical protein
MKRNLLLGLASILGLGFAACSGAGGDNPDAAYIPPQTDVAAPTVDTGVPPAIDTAAPDPYLYVVIQDTEQVACNTNGPGVDVDAVALQDSDAAGTVLGYGKVGTAKYTANPGGDACALCNTTKPCKYAANGGLFTVADLQTRTEGLPDGVVNATTDDQGYFSLNAGTLQIKIGAVDGTGAALQPKSGQFIYVYEVDQGYVTATNGCTCAPEHFTVRLQTASGAYSAQLKPYAPSAANAALCTANPGTAVDGCGSSVFLIP